MHDSVVSFVRGRIPHLSPLPVAVTARRALDVGSYDVNGSARPLFPDARYLGIDARPGPGVDVVADAHDLPLPDASYDVVLCLEMLEHDPAPWETLPELARVTRPGGDVLVTTRGIGFPPHDFPHDYWRFTPSAIELLLEGAGLNVVVIRPDPQAGHPGVLAHARKSPVTR